MGRICNSHPDLWCFVFTDLDMNSRLPSTFYLLQEGPITLIILWFEGQKLHQLYEGINLSYPKSGRNNSWDGWTNWRGFHPVSSDIYQVEAYWVQVREDQTRDGWSIYYPPDKNSQERMFPRLGNSVTQGFAHFPITTLSIFPVIPRLVLVLWL